MESITCQRPRLHKPDANKVLPEDRSIHEWYRFVLSFPPHLVRDYFERLGATPSQTVFDPFAGTGTTLVEAKKAGLASVGVESHPVGHFATSVKINWAVDPDELIEDAEMAVNHAIEALGPRNEFELHSETSPVNESWRRLSDEEAALLLKDSISPLPLHKILVLREAIDSAARPGCRDHLRLALARSAVADASNLHFGPEVGLGAIRDDAPVIESWLNRVNAMAGALREYRPGAGVPAQVFRGDSRHVGLDLGANLVDVVITSPPYPNEKDYTRTTRLESVLLGFIRSKADLKELKGALIRSNTRNVYKHDEDDAWVAGFASIQKVAAEIEQRRLDLGKTSGFERLYHRVTRHYFGGMARHLANLRPLLRRGARLAYVVGDQASFFQVLIRTGTLLAEIAESLGYRVEGIDLFRTRMATATRDTLREEVVRLSWGGRRKFMTETKKCQKNGSERLHRFVALAMPTRTKLRRSREPSPQ